MSDRPLRVTFVLPYAGLAGGVRVVAIHAEQLRRRGHHVTVISKPPRRSSLRDSLAALARSGRWPAARPARSSYFDGTGFEHRILEAHRSITAHDAPDADVVVATWWDTAAPVAALPAEKGAKLYFVQHHEIHDPATADAVRASYRLPLRKAVVSSWLAEVMAQEYGDHNVDLVLNGVDFGQFDAPPRRRGDPPTVGLLYTTKPYKGLAVSLEALRRLRAHAPDLRVRAFGAEPVRADLPLPDGAAFTLQPPQDTLRDIYGGCDVWLWGSFAEGFGLPIAEAMACRCPVVSTRVGAAIDLIEEGVNGHVAPVGDAAALAEALAQVLLQPAAARRAMSDAAYARARRHGWDASTDALEAALRRCAQTGATVR